jgi:hypothetical protein
MASGNQTLNMLHYKLTTHIAHSTNTYNNTTPHYTTTPLNPTQVVYLDPMVETTYTVWVRNSGLDQPLDTSGLRVTLYTKSGRVKQVMRGPLLSLSISLVCLFSH